MGERRKRKSMWDMEEETKRFSGTSEPNCSHSGHPSRESNEEKAVNAISVKNRGISPEGNEIGGGNRYYHNMSPGLDGTERRKYKHSFENDRSDPHRHPRRDRSRSRSRSRSNGSPRGRTRSRSPIRDYRNQFHPRTDQTSLPDNSFRICQDFSSGRCRRGSQCRLLHFKNSSHGNISRDSYSKSDLRDDVSGSSYYVEDEQFRNKTSRNAVPCREFIKGKCKWGDTCRFSHHLPSNAKKIDNRSGGGVENEKVSWRISEYKDTGSAEKSSDKENIGNKSENLILQNQDRNSNFQGQNTLEDRVVANNIATSFGFDGGLNVPEIQLGALFDLHSRMQNDQKDVQMAGMLETKVTPVTNPALFPSPRSDDLKFPKNTDTDVSNSNIPRHNPSNAQPNSVTNEHGHYIDQDNQMQAKQPSREADNFGSSKSKEDMVIVNSKVDEGNRFENLNGGKRVEESICNQDEKAMRIFKNSLIEFVKDILKPTWKEGRLSKEVHKTIVKKVVDKINSTIQAEHVPKTQEKVDQYLSFSKPKIAKLVQAYVERSLKTDS